MKKAMNQSKMILILNTITVVLSLWIIASFAMMIFYGNKVQQASADRYDLTSNANRFIDGSTTLTDEVRAYAATGDEQHYNNYWNEVNVDKNRDVGLANMQEIGLTSEEQSLIAQMSNYSNTLVPFEESAMEMVRAGQTMEAVKAVYGEYYQTTVNQIHQLQKDFLDKLDSRTAKEVASLQITQNVIRTLVVLSVIIVIISQIFNFFVIKKNVITPIIRIQREMEEIANGNLSSNFDLEPDTSEIGRLIGAIVHTKYEIKKYISHISQMLSEIAQGRLNLSVNMEYVGDFRPIQLSLNTILDSLNSMLHQIDIVAEQLTGNADQVAGSSQGLAQGATEQASAVEELSATINDLSHHMGVIAENASKAHEYTSEDSKILDLSTQQMKEMLQAMDDISNASNEISKIIKSIEDIAFQTNILALNAAVEAARAGAAGKGFAVVADEVRNLANKSQEASGNTGLLTQNTTQAVKRGVGLTEATAKTLSTVVSDSQKSASYVEEIATNLVHQSKALQQVNLGIEQISSVVQTNSATAEQSAAAAGELSIQAKQLKELVGKFKLRR